MDKFLSLVISGAVSGAVYSVIASGLVLAYTTSGVFNLAHGAVAFSSAYLFYQLDTGLGWPVAAAGFVAIVVYPAILGLLLDRLMFRHLVRARNETKIVATIGLVLAIPALALWLVERMNSVLGWDLPEGDNVYVAPGLGPSPKESWNVFGTVVIDSNQIVIFVAAIISATVLWYVVRRTRLGLEMRATVDRRDLASMRGIDPGRTSSVAWVLSMILAGLAGVVGAPLFGLSSGQYTLVLFVATTAAVLGGLRSIPIAFAGGLGIGVAQNLVAGYPPPGLSALPGLRASVPAVLLLVALLVLGRDRVRVAGTSAELSPPPEYLQELSAVRRALPWVVATVAMIVYVIGFADRYWSGLFAKGFGLALILMSIMIVTGIGGMVSLAQATFVTAGGLTAGWMLSQGTPFLPALLVGCAVAAVAGTIVAAIGIRLGGLSLALATLALALLADQTLFQLDSIRGSTSGWRFSRPVLGPLDFSSDRAMSMLMLGCVGIAVVLARNLERSATGRSMIAVRSSEPAAASVGISPVYARLAVFAMSAGLAALGGILLASFEGRISNLSYVAADSLIWLAVVVTFGVRRPGAAVLGGIVLALSPEIIGWVTDSGRIPTILFGLGAINLARHPDGSLAQFVEQNHLRRKARQAKRAARRLGSDDAGNEAGTGEPTGAADAEPALAGTGELAAPPRTPVRAPDRSATVQEDARPALVAHGVFAGYGDTEVLHGIDVQLTRGSVTALLGVNGAGKSTLCAVLAGMLPPTAGTVEVLGQDATAYSAHRRARSGLVLAPEGRGIFPGLTVDENLEVWLPTRADRERVYERFAALAGRRRIAGGSLSGGEQQLLALAPLLFRRPEILVVDEPTLGLAPLVVDAVFELFQELRDDGVTLLLAEEKVHNVLSVADRVVYMELGRVLWDLPRDAVDTELLSAAYLGSGSPSTREPAPS